MENNGLNAPDDRIRLVNRDIAFTSDLVALHAAMEAACGGAAGRDFALAADELRHLANGGGLTDRSPDGSEVPGSGAAEAVPAKRRPD